MPARDLFRLTMRRRRTYPRASHEWQYLTRAARKYVWIMRKVPTTEWTE